MFACSHWPYSECHCSRFWSNLDSAHRSYNTWAKGPRKKGVRTKVVCWQKKETRAILEQGRPRCPCFWPWSLSGHPPPPPPLVDSLWLVSPGALATRANSGGAAADYEAPSGRKDWGAPSSALSIRRAVILNLIKEWGPVGRCPGKVLISFSFTNLPGWLLYCLQILLPCHLLDATYENPST